MIDRLEELLAQMAAEDEAGEEEREDVPALADRTVPKAAAPAEEEKPLPAGEDGEAREEGLPELDWQKPGRMVPEESEPKSEEVPRPALETDAAREAWAALRREPAGPALEAAARGTDRAAELQAERHSAEIGRELGETVRRETLRGLEALYDQTVQASRPSPAPQLQSAEQAGRTLRAEEPGRTAALTVEELDRAVRRDSRRYDGGMTIF